MSLPRRRAPQAPQHRLRAVVAATALILVAAGCGRSSGSPAPASGVIQAVGAEAQYANVIAQIGGPYVRVAAIESNPNTDPHAFEANPTVARELAAADLVVINGLGYDDWAKTMLAASRNPSRQLIDVQSLLGLPDNTPDPHLWYRPDTMPAVARQVAADLGVLQPARAAYFQANATRFDASLQPWYAALAAFKAAHAGTAVAVSEPVGDYLLQAAGCTVLTPFRLQAAVMNGTDPSPQDVTFQQTLFSAHRVQVFLYNQQVTDSLTQSFETLARKQGIPIVGLYETMPAGYSYQSWMLAETAALQKAVADKASTTRL